MKLLRIALIIVVGLALQASQAASQAGSIDQSFNRGAVVPGTVVVGELVPAEWIIDLEIDSQGRIVALYFDEDEGARGPLPLFQLSVRRYLETGDLDLTFGTGGTYTVTGSSSPPLGLNLNQNGLALGPSDDIYIGYQLSENFAVRRLNSAGFSTGLQVIPFDLVANGLDVLTNLEVCGDSLYLVGFAEATVGSFDVAVAKLNATTLALDSTFDTDGKTTVAVDLGDTNNDLGKVLRCFANSLLIGGEAADALGVRGLVIKLTSAGALDTNFGSTGIITYRAPLSSWGTSPPPLFRGALPPANITSFEDILIDLNGLLWAAGTAENPDGDLDAVVALTDLTGTLLTAEGVDGWQGAGFSIQDTSPIRGAPPIPTDDFALRILETSPTTRTVVGRNTVSTMLGNVERSFAFRLIYSGLDFDSSFNGDGDNDGRVQPHIPLPNSATWAGDVDRHGRTILGGVSDDGTSLDGFLTRLSDHEILIDGFESGDLVAWPSSPP